VLKFIFTANISVHHRQAKHHHWVWGLADRTRMNFIMQQATITKVRGQVRFHGGSKPDFLQMHNTALTSVTNKVPTKGGF